MSLLKPSYTSGQPSQRLSKAISVVAKATTKAPWCVQSGERVMAGLVLMSLEGAMAWTSLPYNVERPSSQEAKVHFCILYMLPSMCALPTIPSPLLIRVRGGLGVGRVAVLYCFFYTSHSSLIESFYEVQKCPFPHKLAVGGPPAAELQSILQLGEGKEQVYQFRIQVYKSELATCQVLS